MARQVSLSLTLTDKTVTPARRRSANNRLNAPIQTPETSTSSSSGSPLQPGSTLGTPIFIDSGDENDSTPTKQNRLSTRPLHDSSAKNSKSQLLDIPVRAKHTTRVSAKEEAQDSEDNEDRTSGAQEDKDDTSNCTQLVHARLGTVACEKLPKSEEEGFLYVFRDPKHKGAVKIGYSKDVNRRTKEHGKCELDLTFVHISGRVKAMKRAELLIKTDLRHLRRPWKCSACKRTHEEWFEVDEETAKARVTLWVDWINDRDPYDTHGNIEPLWKYLIEYGRKPRKEFGSKNHDARWEHWNWVLSEPLPSDIPGFQKHEKKFSSARRRKMPSQRDNSEQIALTHQQTVAHVDGTSIEALSSLGVSQFLHAATQRAATGGINWTLNINVQCEAHVSQEKTSANGA